MKKVLSFILALVMVLSIGSVGASAASNNKITISADVYHARKGDYAYFPVGYNCQKSYSEYADNDTNSSTKIIIPLLYNDHLIEPVEAIPSEWLYNIGGTAEIIKTDKFLYEGTDFPYIYVEINFDGCADIENDVFFNVKFEVINDNFFDEYGRLDMGGLFDNFYIVNSDDVSLFTYFDWSITKSDGTVKYISSYVRTDSVTEFAGTTYDELLLKDYEPFIPPVEEDVPPSKFDDISVDADVFHARIGDYAYFPLAYDCDTAYKYYVGSDENSKTKIVFPFLYMPDLLEPVEAIPSELLYNMGGTVKITEFGSYVQSNGSAIDYFLVEVNFDGYEGIIDETILFNIKCKVLSEEFFDEYETYKIGIFDNFHMVENGSINFSKSCNWEITMSDGTKKDISSRMQPPMLLFYDEYDSYYDFVLTDYEPFIPPVCDITEATYIQQEDTHKDFTVTANGRKQMIQFIEPDGGTRTYDRYHKNVSITSYNSDGEVVNAMARDLAYEVWEIYSNMSVGIEIQVRGKENYKWDEFRYSFTIEPYNPIISMELSATSGKKGAVPATVVADEKTEKVMFKMPNGTSVTVASTATDENGNKIFIGNAWMNEDGLNEIEVKIYRKNVWKSVGTLEYTVG